MPLIITENGFDYSVVIADQNLPFRLADIDAYKYAQGIYDYKEVEAGWLLLAKEFEQLCLMEMKAWYDERNPKYQEVVLKEFSLKPKLSLGNYAKNKLAKKVIDVIRMLTDQDPINLEIANAINNRIIEHLNRAEPIVALFIIKARPAGYLFAPLRSAIQENITVFLQAYYPTLIDNLTVLVLSPEDLVKYRDNFEVEINNLG